MDGTVVVTLVTGLCTVVASGGLWTWLQSRRTNSGQVATTPAETLWAQMQAMQAATLDQLTKTQDQRDKLIEQRDTLLAGITELPTALASIDSSLKRLLELQTGSKVATP